MEMTIKKEASKSSLFAATVIVPLAVLTSLGAMNSGVAPTTGVWTTVVTYLQGMLQSDFAIGLALVAVIGGIWQLSHGRGYTFLMVVLSIIACAFLAPSAITTLATATRPGVQKNIKPKLTTPDQLFKTLNIIVKS